MNNCPIGVFDSGVGGLSVFAELVKLLPEENYIYFGDTLNAPFGNKTKEQLIQISKNIFDFFKSKNVKAVVMACNTTSAITYDVLKNEYDFKIYPVVQNVSETIAGMGYGKIGVFATNATINSHAYKNELKKYNANIDVFEIACGEWATIVEKSLMWELSSIGNIKMYVDKMMLNNPEKIILGCTHYPYLTSILSEFAPANIFINPASYFAKYIADDLKRNNMLNSKQNFEPKFYVSSNSELFKKSSKLFYQVENVNEISLDKQFV